ncbi:MAG: ATP-grasp domain-containing protein [Thermoproteota archaeon]|nr:ATP-grasp domain-containing protein [Thermoproteota archaeon]
MGETAIHSVLVVGIDVVPIAVSAKNAGYEVYAADYFGDQDLQLVCRESHSILHQKKGKTCGRLSKDFNAEKLLQLAKSLIKRNPIDAALLASGLEDHPEILSELHRMVPIVGNRPDIIRRVRDKTKFFNELARLGVPHPETATVEGLKEAKKEARDIGYPVMVKPSRGFGGTGVRKAQNSNELKEVFQEVSLLDEEVLIQEYISGTPASASLVSSTNEAVILTLNEQLLGMSELGQRAPFGYCGNIVPLLADKKVKDKCERITEKTVTHFSLVGSNGVDLVISKEGTPYVVEVNPRFQGTLECVERVSNLNLVEAHVNACVHGVLPKKMKKNSFFCTRLVLFATSRSAISDLSGFEAVKDVPFPGVIIEGGEPLCSIVADGENRASSLKNAKRIAESVYETLHSTPNSKS